MALQLGFHLVGALAEAGAGSVEGLLRVLATPAERRWIIERGVVVPRVVAT